LKNVIDQYLNTFLNIIENDLNEDRLLFDEYLIDTSSKFIADHRWIEQFRQRIQSQIEPLKTLDLE